MHKNEKWIKLAGTVLCEIFTVCTIIMLLTGGEPDRLLLAFTTLLLAALPMLLETLGAMVTCLIIWFDKGKHPLIHKQWGVVE